MNHLLRSLAPITDSGWELLDREAKQRLTAALAARKLVDFAGPRGWEHSATNLGRATAVAKAPGEGVTALQRRVLPLVELRAAFTVSLAELRDHARGAVDVDLENLDTAAHRIAIAENIAVFHGWPKAGIAGIAEASPHEAIPLGQNATPIRGPSRAPSSCCSTTESPVPTGWRLGATSTPAWSKRQSTAAIPCSITCARSSKARSSGRPG